MTQTDNISIVIENTEVDSSVNPVSTEPASEPVTVEEATTPVTVPDRVVAIPLSTVVRCGNLIEHLSRRWCFHANEMVEVGNLYNVLTKVVNNGVNQIRADQVLPKQSVSPEVTVESV